MNSCLVIGSSINVDVVNGHVTDRTPQQYGVEQTSLER